MDVVTIIATLRWASCGPFAGPQDAQRRVAIIVTSVDVHVANNNLDWTPSVDVVWM